MRTALLLLLLAPALAQAATPLHMSFWDNNSTETAGFTTFNFEASDAPVRLTALPAEIGELWRCILGTGIRSLSLGQLQSSSSSRAGSLADSLAELD